jgi:Uma2 family endonuclease
MEKDFPDLAIEIITTSGGLESLAIYERLEIPEVWFWQNNSLAIYVLINHQYQQQSQSQLLPNLNVSLLISSVQKSDIQAAIAQLFQQ